MNAPRGLPWSSEVGRRIWHAVAIVLWSWCGFAVATRIDLFGVHDWRGEGSPIGMVAPLIEMAIWFSPLALFSTRAEDAPGSGWDVAFRIVVFGFLGLVAGFAAMVLSMLLTAMLLGEDAAAALFAFVIAVG